MAYLKITGVLLEIRWDGKLLVLKEDYEDIFKGETQQRKRIWSCWFDVAPPVVTGETLTIGGDLGTKIGKWDKKNQDGTVEERQIVEHHLRNASLQGIQVRNESTEVDDFPF